MKKRWKILWMTFQPTTSRMKYLLFVHLSEYVVNNLIQFSGPRHERLYFFQFPAPFPSFVSRDAVSSSSKGKEPQNEGRHVSFAENTKEPVEGNAEHTEDVNEEKRPEHVDGVIGQLEVYQS